MKKKDLSYGEALGGFVLLIVVLALIAFACGGCGAGGGGGAAGGGSDPSTVGAIQGTVTDGRAAVSGVLVQVVGQALQTTTDANGFYRINNIPVGNRTLRFSKDGYTSSDQPVNIIAGQIGNCSPSLTAARPQVDSVSPTSGANGTAVTITGLGFGNVQGTVTFNGQVAGAATSWSDTRIILSAPNSTTGPVVVTVGGVASQEVINFTYLAPIISGLNPTSGPVGSSVTITGTNFGTSQGTSKVAFNGTDAGTATSWVNTQIIVSVPTGATTGNVVITTGAGTSNGATFTVTPTVYYKLVADREYNIGAGLESETFIPGTSQGTVLAVVMAGEIVLVNPNNGSILYQTTHNCGGTGIVYRSGKLFVAGAQNRRYSVDINSLTINETPEITTTWSSQPGYVNTINNLIAITSFTNGQVGLFDTNLDNPPNPLYIFELSVNDIAATTGNTEGWATSAQSSGKIFHITNLTTGEYSTWTTTVPFAWGIDQYQGTVFLTGPCPIAIGQNRLTSCQPDGQIIWQSVNFTWYPRAIRVYYNSVNSSEEAAVTGDDGKLHIYKVVEN